MRTLIKLNGGDSKRYIQQVADSEAFPVYAFALDPTLWSMLLARIGALEATAASRLSTVTGFQFADDRALGAVNIPSPNRKVDRMLIRRRGTVLEVYSLNRVNARARVWTSADDSLVSVADWELIKGVLGTTSDGEAFAVIATASGMQSVEDKREAA